MVNGRVFRHSSIDSIQSSPKPLKICSCRETGGKAPPLKAPRSKRFGQFLPDFRIGKDSYSSDHECLLKPSWATFDSFFRLRFGLTSRPGGTPSSAGLNSFAEAVFLPVSRLIAAAKLCALEATKSKEEFETQSGALIIGKQFNCPRIHDISRVGASSGHFTTGGVPWLFSLSSQFCSPMGA